jgi:hypothetical protein
VPARGLGDCGRGQSVGCQLNNAKIERTANDSTDRAGSKRPPPPNISPLNSSLLRGGQKVILHWNCQPGIIYKAREPLYEMSDEGLFAIVR